MQLCLQPDLYIHSVASHASLVTVRLWHLSYFVPQVKVIWTLRLDERKIHYRQSQRTLNLEKVGL